MVTVIPFRIGCLLIAALAAPHSAQGRSVTLKTFETTPQFHSCYYYIVHENHCVPGHGTPSQECIQCADKNLSALEKLGCTPVLISSACSGTLPPEPPSPPSPPSPPKPGDLILKLLPEAASEKGAVCLDGSPAGYYFRAGLGSNASKFLIIFQGGGWCRGDDDTATGVDCAERAEKDLGSSKVWKSAIEPDAHGMDNPDCSVNPAFCTWTVVYMYYCDGMSFSGNREDPLEVPGAKISPIYFRGKRILEANIKDLIVSHNLDQATDVVLSGHSAGGLATYLHADQVREMLPSTLSSYSAVPDAGFFLDHANTSGAKAYGLQMRTAFKLANTSWAFNSQCASTRTGDDIYDCVFPQNFAQFINTRLHVTQSQYDSYQLKAILGLTCKAPVKGDCTLSELAIFQQYHVDLKAALNASGLFSGGPNRSIWNDACIAHTQGYYGDYMDNTDWEVPANSGITLAKSLDMWLAQGVSVHVDQVPWPQNAPCASADIDFQL